MTQYWHWSERLADEVKKRERPWVFTSGVTPSGPVHLGTVCEFLYQEAIYRQVGGDQFYFIGDVMDALDSVTAELQEYKDELEKHMGKPLFLVPNPKNPKETYADLYLNEIKEMVKAFGAHAKVIPVKDLYDQGLFDPYAKLYWKEIEKVKEIIERTSGRQLPKHWNPVMPICEKCERIDKTKVLSFDAETGDYQYKCEACGHEGKGNLSQHRYKLQWRLHWPTWHAVLGTTIEGGGVDHFTRGGSWDTAKAIHKEILKREPPIGYRFGFLLLGGKKYSKSKGIGMYVKEMIRLLPPPVIAYHLIKYDLEENIDFALTPQNILNITDDYEQAAKLTKEEAEGSRALRKKYVSFKLFGKRFKASFREMLLYYTIYRDWEKVGKHISYDEELVPYIEEWVRRGFVPQDYDFSYRPKKAEGIVKEFIERLQEGMDALDIHNFVYEFAQEKGIQAKDLFKALYETLIGKPRGPRLGKLIYAIGVNKVKEDTL
ncbi:MAG: lysine--tRNA ligase [Candidatus Micrarchaeota archaeon]|nr:lysine--tRNA ligase [Candidatus Micrarchaeota archaeon]